MAKITRPGEFGSLGRSQIGSASTAGRGLISAGQAVTQTGREVQQNDQLRLSQDLAALVDQEGTRLFEESKRSHQSATLLNKSTAATEEFLKVQQERYKRQVDDEGNPTFTTLHSDIESIGKEILNRTADTIIDPEVAQAFKVNFGDYIANQKISALQEGARQQFDYSSASLSKGLGSLINQASRDDISQLGNYESQGIEALQEALAGGLIGHQDFQNQSAAFRETVRVGAYQNLIHKNRNKAKELFSQDADALGISGKARGKLIDILEDVEKEEAKQIAEAREQQGIDDAAEEAAIISDAKSKIQAGSLKGSELKSLKDLIAPSKYEELAKDYLKVTQELADERQDMTRIGHRILNGETLIAEDSKTVDKVFENAVNLKSDTTGQPVSLEEQAELATAFKGPVNIFAEKLQYSAKFGEVSSAEDILGAYTYVKELGLPTLDTSFDKQSVAIMEYTEFLTERGGIPASQALRQARERVLEVDDPVHKAREAEFKQIDAFKPINIEETAAETLGLETFFINHSVDPDIRATFKELAREGFRLLGDEKSAKNYAKQRMSKNYGHSTISGSKEYVYGPVEKLLEGVFTVDEVRDILKEEVKDLIPEGVDLNSVSLEATDLTINRIQVVGKDKQGKDIKLPVPSWSVTYEQDGERIPLRNETGDVRPWTPLGTDVMKKKILEAQQERLEGRKRFTEEEKLFRERFGGSEE